MKEAPLLSHKWLQGALFLNKRWDLKVLRREKARKAEKAKRQGKRGKEEEHEG